MDRWGIAGPKSSICTDRSVHVPPNDSESDLSSASILISVSLVCLATYQTIGYEKKEKNDVLEMSKFFERDYVRFNVLKTLVAATVVYWAVVGAYVFVSFEVILNSINNMDYFGVMYRILGWYVMFCFIYFIFAAK